MSSARSRRPRAWLVRTVSMPKAEPKSDETRRRILAAAMDLFRSRGFEQTTMREIAHEAGVALGSAYYYFASKEALVMAFYQQARDETHALIVQTLPDEKDLQVRIRAIVEVKLRYFGPNRKFLGALFGHAADPANPLSPFSAETRDIRENDIRHFSDALDQGKVKIPADLKQYVPRLLWLYQMGLILFWIYDHSPRQARTEQLIDKSLALVVNLIKVSRFPLLRPIRKMVVGLLDVVYA
jgi:AcrR family transcriptional regulator